MFSFFNRWLIGPGIRAEAIRWSVAVAAFAAIYFHAFKNFESLNERDVYVLGAGYLLVLLVGCWWWHEERRRLNITRQYSKAVDPDSGPDLRLFALAVVLQLLVLFPLLFKASGKFEPQSSQDDRWPWFLVTVDHFWNAMRWAFEQFGALPPIRIVPKQNSAPWSGYLGLIRDWSLNFVLLAAIWRGINVHVDIAQAISALADSSEPSVRVGRRATGKLRKVLRSERYAKELYAESATAARQNAAAALGRILEGIGESRRLGWQLSPRAMYRRLRELTAKIWVALSKRRRWGWSWRPQSETTKTVEALCSILNAPNCEQLRGVKKNAAEALGMIGDPGAGTLLCDILMKEADAPGQAELCKAIIKALKMIRPPSAVGTLCSFLETSSAVMARRYAADLLGELDDVSAIDELVKSLDDDDSGLRHAALRALRRLCVKSAEKATQVRRKLKELIASRGDSVVKDHAEQVDNAIGEFWKKRDTPPWVRNPRKTKAEVICGLRLDGRRRLSARWIITLVVAMSAVMALFAATATRLGSSGEVLWAWIGWAGAFVLACGICAILTRLFANPTILILGGLLVGIGTSKVGEAVGRNLGGGMGAWLVGSLTFAAAAALWILVINMIVRRRTVPSVA